MRCLTCLQTHILTSKWWPHMLSHHFRVDRPYTTTIRAEFSCQLKLFQCTSCWTSGHGEFSSPHLNAPAVNFEHWSFIFYFQISGMFGDAAKKINFCLYVKSVAGKKKLTNIMIIFIKIHIIFKMCKTLGQHEYCAFFFLLQSFVDDLS